MSIHRVDVVPVLLETHSNADTLSIVRVGEYTVVVRTSDWADKSTAAYVEPDYVVPADRDEFKFLAQSHKEIENGGVKGYRIKTKRLRGVMSMGLLVPAPSGSKVGDNVMERMGVVRYEPPFHSSGGESTNGPAGVYYKYDVENGYRYSPVLVEGEEVVVTEKIHGCLAAHTRVMMADGSQLRIQEIYKNKMIRASILGMDDEGKITETKITNVFKHSRTDEWLQIKGQRRAVGRGSSHFSVHVTPNHQFWNGEAYTEAGALTVGDKVYVLRSELVLAPVQEQILFGKLLGDGALGFYPSGSASVAFSHRIEDVEYTEWTLRGLGGIGKRGPDGMSGYGTKMSKARTTSLGLVADAFHDFVKDGRKVIPERAVTLLTPIALAFWYMDDGSLGGGGGQEYVAHIAVCSFTEEECAILLEGLSRLGIKGTYYKDGGKYSRFRFNDVEAEKLFLLVSPYVPPCMQRKLPSRYRGHEGWLPPSDSSYKTHLVPCLIDEIVMKNDRRSRYDIETTTHNFFANNILVHNSNGRFTWSDGEMHCGSRTEWKKESAESLWWKALAATPSLRAFCEANPGACVYGEVYGQVQDLKYGVKGVAFAAFDVLRAGRWLNHDEGRALLDKHGVPVVPVLYRGPWDKERVKAMADGRSEVAATSGVKQVREGIVVKPLLERRDDELGRVQIKFVSGNYLERV